MVRNMIVPCTNPSSRCECKSDDEQYSMDEESSGKYPFVGSLCMSGGDLDQSYFTNSLLQKRVLSMTKPILVKNTKEMLTDLDFPKCIKVADLGCSSGQNTFLAMSEIFNTINVLCQEQNQSSAEIECCLNDLPTNDFNTTFKLINLFKKLTSKGSCFIYGVPGSFYSRLFPSKSLHFINSIYSIHFLSKVPQGLEKNKMSVYITNSSPISEYKAYLNQFQRDFTTFLRMRSEEMVSNGRMVLTLIGRNTLHDPLYRDCCHFWTLLSNSLCVQFSLRLSNRGPTFSSGETQTMLHSFFWKRPLSGRLELAISETLEESRDFQVVAKEDFLRMNECNMGLLSESKVNSFKMPFYDPTEEEVKEIIMKEGSFQIQDLETHGFDHGYSNEDHSLQSNGAKAGQKEASCIRAVTETMLAAHFGDAIIDALFNKYANHVAQHASCRVKTNVTLIVSLIRK